MALDDLAHVEAVAIIRRYKELGDELHHVGIPASEAARVEELDKAATVFLREHHPDPATYVKAIGHASRR